MEMTVNPNVNIIPPSQSQIEIKGQPLLELKNLHTFFTTRRGVVKAVNGVSYAVERGKTLGIVGESGSGKSVSAMSVLGLLDGNGKVVEGEITFKGNNITNLAQEELAKIRGNEISVIFQEPMTSLNPIFTVRKQIGESFQVHQNMSRYEAYAEAVKILADVKIPDPEQVARRYPFMLSGGMRQRVMIAMALACKPDLLIADEPTTALDVTIQAQILHLMNELKREKGTAIMFITHDLGVINQMADEVAVMYCGQVVEQANVRAIFGDSAHSHPYTEALLTSIPRLDTPVGTKLEPIEGSVPHPLDLPVGCKFAPRCKYCTERCQNEEPKLVAVSENQLIRCFYPEEGARKSGK